jgi:hypothetical protein
VAAGFCFNLERAVFFSAALGLYRLRKRGFWMGSRFEIVRLSVFFFLAFFFIRDMNETNGLPKKPSEYYF